jgi:hypothetical protein
VKKDLKKMYGTLTALLLVSLALIPPITAVEQQRTFYGVLPTNPLIIEIGVGSDYDYGMRLGELQRDAYKAAIDLFWKSVERSKLDVEGIRAGAERHISVLEDHYPQYLERIRGISRGSGIPIVDLLALELNAVDLYKLFDCTTGAAGPKATANGESYLVWTMDLYWFTYALIEILTPILYPLMALMDFGIEHMPGLFSFIVREVPGGYKSIGLTIPILGLSISLMNEKGLSFVGNNNGLVGDPADVGEGLSSMELLSKSLDYCANVHEAADLIESLPRAAGAGLGATMNIIFGDGEGGIASIEYSHNYFAAAFSGKGEIHREYIDGDYTLVGGREDILGQANHHQYLPYELTGSPSPGDYQSSWIRADRIWELLNEHYGEIDLDICKEILSDRKNGPIIAGIQFPGFNSIDRNGLLDQWKYTVWGENALIADYGPCETNCCLIVEPMSFKIHFCTGHASVSHFVTIDFTDLLT